MTKKTFNLVFLYRKKNLWIVSAKCNICYSFTLLCQLYYHPDQRKLLPSEKHHLHPSADTLDQIGSKSRWKCTIPIKWYQLHTTILRRNIWAQKWKTCLTIHKIDNNGKLTCSKSVDVASPFCFLFRHRSHHTYSFSCEWSQKCNIQIPVVCCNVVLKSNIYILILKNYQKGLQCIQNEIRHRNYHDILNNSTWGWAIYCNMTPFFLRKWSFKKFKLLDF